jgi:hypothetical protein
MSIQKKANEKCIEYIYKEIKSEIVFLNSSFYFVTINRNYIPYWYIPVLKTIIHSWHHSGNPWDSCCWGSPPSFSTLFTIRHYVSFGVMSHSAFINLLYSTWFPVNVFYHLTLCPIRHLLHSTLFLVKYVTFWHFVPLGVFYLRSYALSLLYTIQRFVLSSFFYHSTFFPSTFFVPGDVN